MIPPILKELELMGKRAQAVNPLCISPLHYLGGEFFFFKLDYHYVPNERGMAVELEPFVVSLSIHEHTAPSAQLEFCYLNIKALNNRKLE